MRADRFASRRVATVPSRLQVAWWFDWLDDRQIARLVRERDAVDTGARVTLDELLVGPGIDVDKLRRDVR